MANDNDFMAGGVGGVGKIMTDEEFARWLRDSACPSGGLASPTGSASERMNQPCLPDTGRRREFGTGAVRDASVGKGHFHSIPPLALKKLAKRFEDGAAKYSKNNWMRGIPLSAYVDSISRHFLAIQEGDTSEDHAGALIWNACCMAWTDEEIKAGRLPKELDDLPYRKQPTQ